MRYLNILFITLLFPSFTSGPLVTYKTDKALSSLSIQGTSTLHDWEIKAENMQGVINVDLFKDSLYIKSLKLSIPVLSVKSGTKAMDKNTYNTLKSDDHPTIHYELTGFKILKKVAGNKFEITSKGMLNVAGNTKSLTVPIEAILKDDGIAISGETSFLMSEFGIEPPAFMFGSVTTGDKVNIQFNINYN